MVKRLLGKTGERLSVVGFGGLAIYREPYYKEIVAHAIHRGINYFDVAPSYGTYDHEVERALGEGLKPYRKQVFLADKTGKRTAELADGELDETLAALGTDYLDLYQLHGISNDDDVEIAMGPGGAIETLERAKKAGKARFLGFSVHAEEPAVKLLGMYDWDVVLFPLNWAGWLAKDFGKKLLDAAVAKGVGRCAIKTTCKSLYREDEKKPWEKAWAKPFDNYADIARAVTFTLSQNVTACMSPGYTGRAGEAVKILEWMMDAAEDMHPLTQIDVEYMRREAEFVIPPFPSKKPLLWRKT